MKSGKTFDVKAEYKFSAEPAKVYDAWLDEELAQRWFGPGLGETLPVSIDSRVGGRFRIVQIRDNLPVGHSGEYLVLERPKHLSFTWETDDAEETDIVNIWIEPDRKGSKVIVVHTMDLQWKEFGGSAKSAWLSMMAKMNELLQ
jgi:uncharacterized protein YndB with AHSA1/START domain